MAISPFPISLSLIFSPFINQQTSNFGFLEVSDSFFGGIISAKGLFAYELVKICYSNEKLDFERLQETILKKIENWKISRNSSLRTLPDTTGSKKSLTESPNILYFIYFGIIRL
jgi:hypothetical protein